MDTGFQKVALHLTDTPIKPEILTTYLSITTKAVFLLAIVHRSLVWAVMWQWRVLWNMTNEGILLPSNTQKVQAFSCH